MSPYCSMWAKDYHLPNTGCYHTVGKLRCTALEVLLESPIHATTNRHRSTQIADISGHESGVRKNSRTKSEDWSTKWGREGLKAYCKKIFPPFRSLVNATIMYACSCKHMYCDPEHLRLELYATTRQRVRGPRAWEGVFFHGPRDYMTEETNQQ